MDAEPAGGESVNHATESTTATTIDPAADPNSIAEDAQPDASSARVTAILQEEGLSDEEISEVVQPKEKPNAEKAETSASPGPQKGPTDSDAAEKEKPQARKEKEPGKEKAGDEEEALTPEEQKAWPPEALQRIHKKTAQTKDAIARAEAAEQRAQAAEQKLQSAGKTAAPTPTAKNPLADVDSPEGIEAAVAEYRQTKLWAMKHRDGATDVVIGKDAAGKPITRDFSAEQIADLEAELTEILEERVPERIALLSEQWQHEQVAKERLPAMFEKGTEENKFLEAAKRELPEIMNLPGVHNFVRWAWMGRQQDIEAAKTGAANGDGKTAADKAKVDPKVAPFLRKHPPMAPAVPAARASEDDRRKVGEAEVTQAKQRVEAGEGEEAEVDLVSKLRESQSPRKGAVLV